jgi:cold shock protein
MTTGTVSRYVNPTGYSFLITPDGGGADVYAISPSITAKGFAVLAVGQRVSFDVVTAAKGVQAVNIQPISS